MITLQALNQHYVEMLTVPPLKITKDVWPQFAYDLLTHPTIGVGSISDLPVISKIAVFYKLTRDGLIPSYAQYNSIVGEANLHTYPLDPDRGANNTVISLGTVAYLLYEKSGKDSDAISSAVWSSSAYAARAFARKVGYKQQLQYQYDHLRTLLEPNVPIHNIEF